MPSLRRGGEVPGVDVRRSEEEEDAELHAAPPCAIVAAQRARGRRERYPPSRWAEVPVTFNIPTERVVAVMIGNEWHDVAEAAGDGGQGSFVLDT